MRILHTEWSDGLGGQEMRVLSEMEGMLRRGHEVFLATRPSCRVAELAQQRGIRVKTLPMRRSLDLRSILELRQHLRREQIDVVNTHSGVDSWIGGIAARLAGAPVLLRTRHLNFPLKRTPLNFVHYLPDRIVTCGEAIRKDLIERDGFNPARLVNIPTGIDFSRFVARKSRGTVRMELGRSETDFLVLMVGILRGVKGHEFALQALAIIAKKRPEIFLLLAGDGPMGDHLRQRARELGIESRVRFLGFRDDIPDLMNAADMLLLTSKSEGVPQSVTQALGIGLPVAATRVGGVPELIEHDRTGLLVPRADPQAAADAIEYLLQNPERARRFARAAKAHALAHFSLDAMLDKTERLCIELLGQKEKRTNLSSQLAPASAKK